MDYGIIIALIVSGLIACVAIWQILATGRSAIKWDRSYMNLERKQSYERELQDIKDRLETLEAERH